MNKDSMSWSWQRMTVEEFTDFERILEQSIVPVNGIYWRQVRPLFYRPLLPFREYQPSSLKPPFSAVLGGFQHGVRPGEKANSFLNLVMFENIKNYSLDFLNRSHRRQIVSASKRFTVCPITDKEEFKEKAYPVYLSFYKRTRYQYGSQRIKQDHFSQWADALFLIPKRVVLGGFLNGELAGVSLPLLVEDTICYTMFFCNTESLRLNLPAFMLHSIMETAVQCECAKQIFAGYYKFDGGKGVDDFYVQRGWKVVRKPAYLHLNPLSKFFLRNFLPRQYAHLLGNIQQTSGGGPDNIQGSPSLNGIQIAATAKEDAGRMENK